MNPQKDHTPLLVICLVMLGCTSLGCATVLINKGYTAELMVGIAAGCASSLGTMLGQRRAQQQATGGTTGDVAGDVTITAPKTNTP